MTGYELHPDMIRANLRKARETRDEAWRAYEEAVNQVEWWERGAKLFGGATEIEVNADARLGDLLPDGIPRQPTLKQAILLIMRSNPNATWTVDQIAQMLNMNGWLPTSEPAKRISDMAGVMVNEFWLSRTDRGTYALMPDIAVALSSRFPPITDYTRVPDGFPVPDHPAASEGLADDG